MKRGVPLGILFQPVCIVAQAGYKSGYKVKIFLHFPVSICEKCSVPYLAGAKYYNIMPIICLPVPLRQETSGHSGKLYIYYKVPFQMSAKRPYAIPAAQRT